MKHGWGGGRGVPPLRIPPFQGGKRRQWAASTAGVPGLGARAGSSFAVMSWRFDDKLPVPERRPRPSGWFEVACRATVMFALLGVLIALALIRSRPRTP